MKAPLGVIAAAGFLFLSGAAVAAESRNVLGAAFGAACLIAGIALLRMEERGRLAAIALSGLQLCGTAVAGAAIAAALQERQGLPLPPAQGLLIAGSLGAMLVSPALIIWHLSMRRTRARFLRQPRPAVLPRGAAGLRAS